MTALRLFMRRGAPLAPLRALVDEMRKAAKRGKRAAVVRAELRFHREVAHGSGNRLLSEMFDDMEGLLLLALTKDDSNFAQLEDIAAEHEPIVLAIEEGDEERAAQVFEQHLVATIGAELGDAVTGLLGPRR